MPTVFYDADCSICTNGARRFGRILARRGIALEALQAGDACERLRISEDERLAEMRLRLDEGTVFGGAAALAEIARRIWWAWPVWAISRLPGVMPSMRAAYRWLAGHRGCVNGVCRIAGPPKGRTIAVLPLVVPPIVASTFRSRLPAWAFMWTMAFALFAGCKWLTYREAQRTAGASRSRAFAYLLAWPGMDDTPRWSEWVAALLETAAGAALIGGASRVAASAPTAAGWLAIAGVVFLLHFGTFHVLSLFWRRRGVHTSPVMRNPLRSTSLAEFWGRRWNTAFRELGAR